MKFSTHISNNNQIEEDDNFNFKEVILNYLRYWRFFVISISIALIAAFLTNKFTPPVYKIESKFLIREEANAMNLIDFGTTGEGEVLPKGQKLANETVIFKSRRVAGDVIDQLHFDVEYYKERNFQEGRFVNSEMYSNTPIIAEIDWSHSQLSDGQIRVTWQNRESYQLEFLDDSHEFHIVIDKCIRRGIV